MPEDFQFPLKEEDIVEVGIDRVKDAALKTDYHLFLNTQVVGDRHIELRRDVSDIIPRDDCFAHLAPLAVACFLIDMGNGKRGWGDDNAVVPVAQKVDRNPEEECNENSAQYLDPKNI